LSQDKRGDADEAVVVGHGWSLASGCSGLSVEDSSEFLAKASVVAETEIHIVAMEGVNAGFG
jgi:hypothetical protein